tara:strand:- start:10634 stop:11035 length:402 start_codon:yes stop_codon:yes gene_type:complete
MLEKIENYPTNAKERLLELRQLVLNVAAKTDGVGEIEECLKWGELSFVTSQSKSGSTIRIDWKERDPDRCHLYFNCQTKLISIFKELYPDDFEYGGNRSLSIPLKKRLPKRKLSKCIAIALTYNLKSYKDFLI